MMENPKVVTLPNCAHRFHEKCVSKVLNNLCPMCRTPMGGPDPRIAEYVAVVQNRGTDLQYVDDTYKTEQKCVPPQ